MSFTNPTKYRKKPVIVEAICFDGSWTSGLTIMNWAPGTYFVGEGYEHPLRRENEYDPGNGHIYSDRAKAFLVIKTLEGNMRADQGDWIIKGVKGEFYPCKPDIFEATYEEEL